MVDTVYPYENEFDSKMTSKDIDNIEEAIKEFTTAWENLKDVCNDMSGDCNEIISETLGLKNPKMSWQTQGSLDDVYYEGLQKWGNACRENIQTYRDHLAKKSTKLIKITRPAWIQETYKISFLQSGMTIPKEGKGIDPSVIRQWLEDENTIQLGTEVSCHMDANDSHLDEMEDDYDRITLDEITEEDEDDEEEYDWNPDWKPPVSIKEDK